jgi:hypothetical protein
LAVAAGTPERHCGDDALQLLAVETSGDCSFFIAPLELIESNSSLFSSRLFASHGLAVQRHNVTALAVG